MWPSATATAATVSSSKVAASGGSGPNYASSLCECGKSGVERGDIVTQPGGILQLLGHLLCTLDCVGTQPGGLLQLPFFVILVDFIGYR